MITFTGVHVTREFGAPTVQDIAVQTMRMVRFGGGARVFWTVGMHSLLVADLLPPALEFHGLLHDAAEICVGEVPRPFKTDAARELEHAVMARIYAGLGLALPTKREAALIHEADLKAVCAEGLLGCGSRGFVQTQPSFRIDEIAVQRLQEYLLRLDCTSAYADMLNAEGRWPREFEERLRLAITRHIHTPAYKRQYTAAA